MTDNAGLLDAPLGKKTAYISEYDPSLLFAIPRNKNRAEIGVPMPLPFEGVDVWTAYEISWLNPKGKPEIALADFYIPCDSPFLVESKSFKLYLNSFNQTKFQTTREVEEILRKDLKNALGAELQIKLYPHAELEGISLSKLPGMCLDGLDIETDAYEIDPALLTATSEQAEEVLHSHLLKSNCLVTGQPDWGSVFIHYKGPKIDHASLLKYIVSYRCHNEFAEQCAERIYMDLMRQCRPEKLTVYARYTRRGGLDINPFRSNFQQAPLNGRLPRQ